MEENNQKKHKNNFKIQHHCYTHGNISIKKLTSHLI